MQKKLVQSSLALTAAAALGLGGAFVAGPAAAASPQQALTAQSAEKEAKSLDVVNAFGFEDGTLHLGVEDKSDLNADEIKALQKKYGADKVEVLAGVPEAEAQSAKDLVGGAGYLMQIPSTGALAVCSTGFSGWDDDGNPVVLTAGHCAADYDEEAGTITGETDPLDTEVPSSAPAMGGENTEASGLGPVGSWGPNEYGSAVKDGETTGNEGDIDFAVIEVDDSAYNVKNGVADWKSNDLSSTATKITSVGAHTEGKISKAGRTTGLTEGDVIPKSQAPFEYMAVSGRWVHGFGVKSEVENPFSSEGDSGGAVFQGKTAVGVISGGIPETSFVDEDDNPVGDPFAMGWVADLDYSLESTGFDFNLTKPGEETPDAPVAPTVENQTIEPKGDVTGKAEAGAKVEVTWEAAKGAEATKGAQAAKQDSETVEADKAGNFKLEGPEAEGDYDYSATAVVDGQESEATEFQVTVEKEETEAPAPVEREINVDPKEIVASDFVKEDKGVTVTVKGFDEGEKVTLKVASGPENVEGITLDETANENGAAAFSIYGTSETDPSVYLGKYDLTVTGANDTDDEKALAGSFSVVADEDGNGGGGNDDGDDGNKDDDNGNGGDGGSELPRTGAELTGLAAGAGLLVVGGAAVVLTMRRNKKN